MEILQKLKEDRAKLKANDPLESEGGWVNVEDQGYYKLRSFTPKLGKIGRVKMAIDRNNQEELYSIEIWSEYECLLLEFYSNYEDCLDGLIKYETVQFETI